MSVLHHETLIIIKRTHVKHYDYIKSELNVTLNMCIYSYIILYIYIKGGYSLGNRLLIKMYPTPRRLYIYYLIIILKIHI